MSRHLSLLILIGAILLLLTGLTVTVAIMGLIVVVPLAILMSPLVVPVAALAVIAGMGLVLVGGWSGGISWLYKYVRGFRPPGSEGADYARERIYDTGRYLQSKLKDVAPGA